MVITTSAFLSDTTLFIRDALVTGVTDPISSSRGGDKFVMSSYPKRNTKYPIITVLANAGKPTRLGLRSEEMAMPIDFEIRVWARDMKEKDNLTQNVINTLRDLQTTASTGTIVNELFGLEFNPTTDVDEIEGDASGIAIKSKIITGGYFTILA